MTLGGVVVAVEGREPLRLMGDNCGCERIRVGLNRWQLKPCHRHGRELVERTLQWDDETPPVLNVPRDTSGDAFTGELRNLRPVIEMTLEEAAQEFGVPGPELPIDGPMREAFRETNEMIPGIIEWLKRMGRL